MKKHYPVPFPFKKMIQGEKDLNNLQLQEGIHEYLRLLILTRLGDLRYERNLGFEIWEHDYEVLYTDGKSPKSTRRDFEFLKSTIEEWLKKLIEAENRLDKDGTKITLNYGADKDDKEVVYQTWFEVTIDGMLADTKDTHLEPPFNMKFSLSPYMVAKDN